MTSLSLRIVLDEGAVTKTLMFDAATKVKDAHGIVRDKILTLDPNKEHGFFLTSVENDSAGFWLQENKTLEYYMLRDGDSLYYLPKFRNLKVRMLDGAVKTLQVDESQKIEDLMVVICEKIGTANHEEYGLCREEMQAVEETTKPSTGTLTLKRKTREKDAQLQQMSKKLKTDDNVEWLDQRKTLRELRVEPKDTLLFKRRLFYSDRNIDSRDPVQLNLLYVQTRDAILDGRQVVTEEKAVEFAGIQCQIQYGDFQEKKHKPGFIENLKEFLPEQYANSWGVEKKVIRMHQKLVGMSSVEAKHLYTKTARELPTYGVTFFLVKEQQKGKKKLVPRLLGINSESILRLDEGTKEILQTWLLTQVKSYTAGNESFTLNFGDYSDKSYVVKTNEATRIKDILEGYIDIIRKKLSAPYNYTPVEGEAICEDMVESSKGTMVQTVTSSKVMEHSLVGPSQIISVDQGHNSQQGTQIVTVQQVITSVRGDKSQQATKGEISMLSNIPQDFGKTLNHLNSECVKTVVLLSNPTAENLQQVRKIVDDLEDGMPGIKKGVIEVAGSLHGDASQKLLEDLDELCNYMNTLATTTRRSDLRNPDRLMEAQEAARKVAEISTMMCFSLDPKTKRRSTLLMRSRNSFIQDEKTEASLRRASFINAADNASQAVEEAQEDLDQRYNGPILSDEELRRLEIKAVDRMGKLNAAIALLLNSHADPRNIDYEMAVNSMKTINEIMPEFVQDAKPLTGVGDSSSGRALREQIGQLLNRTGTICKLTGSHNIHAMQFEGDEYANVANKLIYTFSRANCKLGGKPMPDEENKITSQCKDIEEKANLLLSVTNELMSLEQNDPRTSEVEAAQVKCSDAVRGLLACAKLTAPSIHEPHCQSALTAAAENLSSSAQSLILCSKPLVEKPNRHNIGHQLTDGSFNLARALDKLKEMYANFNGPKAEEMDISEGPMQEANRLKFIDTAASTRNAIMDAESELRQIKKTPMPLDTKPTKRDPAVQRLLSQKLAQLNAAVAALLKATSDQDNPDYVTAELAANTIRELAPDIIKNTQSMQGTMNENSWNETISTLEDMLEATRGIFLNAEDSNIQEMNNAASKFANSSGKLVYVFNPRKNPRKEKEIIDLSRAALRDTSGMLANVYLLTEAVGGKDGDELDSAGVKVVDAAQLLLRTAEITAPSISDARCQATLLSSIDSLSDVTRMLESTWKPLVQSSDYCQIVDDLNRDLNVVQIGLKKLRRACQDNTDEEDITNGETDENNKQQEIKRLKFIATKTAAKNALIDANKQFDEIMTKPKAKKSSDDFKNRNPEIEHRVSEKLVELNAAIAKFLQANSDKENPDYEVAEVAFNDICKITPDIIKDSEHLYRNIDDESWKEIAEHLKAILDATQGMCSMSHEDDVKDMNDAATKFAKSSGKLIYIFYRRKNPKKEEQISGLSRSAVEQTSQMFSRVHQLAGSVGGTEGNSLDEAGVKVVDAAHQLMKTAEITAPSISDARCKETLLSAIQRLSGHLKDLENTWMPFIDSHPGTGNQLNNDLKSVKMVLNSLRDACLDCAENNDTTGREIGENEIQERKKFKFIATKSAAKEALSEADKQLNEIMIKPVSKKSNDDISRTNPEVPLRIYGKLAELNAAVATLVQASADNNNPDYENAEMAINNICKLTPDIIKDTKPLHGNLNDKSWKEIADHLKAILDAIQQMCSNSHEGDVQEINEGASKFAESSGKLIYIFNPRKNRKKEEEISDLSRSAAEQTSQMLSRVYQLAESVGGEQGTKLDEAGVRVVDVAKQLLKTAEITAPSISDARCRETLLSAIQRLSGHLKDLEITWMPLVNEPKHRELGNELQHNLKSVEMVLNHLKDACLDGAGNDELPVSGIRKDEMQERKRLQFIATKSAAIKSLTEADKQLEEIFKKPIPKESKDQNKSPDVKRNLAEKLAGLNAAIATLLQASSDRDNPDYDSAETAINNVCKLTEDIIKDTDHLRGCTDDKTLKETVGHLKAMLNATRGICSNCRENDFKEMNDAASTFAKSSGKLIYIFNPRVNPKKEEQISLLSRSAVEQTSRMLSHVYQLTESVGNEDGHKLDDVGVKVVDFAQQLLKTAEVTAPSIADTRCKKSLLEAINRLSDQLRAMENTWKPLVKKPEHHQTGDLLNKDLNLIQIALDKLKDACHDDNGTDTIKHPETQRLLYIATALKAKKAMQAAEKELNDKTPVKAIEKSEVPAMKRSLSQRLARLNSSIASLVLATADEEKPDYNVATRSIDTISHLTPDIIRDVKSIKGDIDKKTWKIVDENLNDVVVITRNICRHVEDNNPQELKEEAYRCAKSVGRLSYVFGPAPDTRKENQILDQSRSAAEQTSLMLSDVQQLAEKIGGDASKKLNSYQIQVARASKILQKTAEILAPTISDAYCQETLISCVDELSKLSEELKRTWKPIVQAPQLRQNGEKLEENLKHVHTTLDKLRNACQKTDDSEATTSPTHINVQHAKDKIKEIEKLFLEDKALEMPANEGLNKPGTAIKPITEQREQISHNIGALNEAMARLLQAMLDLKNPDNVRRVEKSIDVMSKLTPDIVRETMALQRNVDDDSRQILFEEAKSLCTASQAICDSVKKGNMEELNNAASQYAQTSRKLRYIISTRTYPNKEKKILDMSRSACERTSLMLSRVSRLAQHIEREKRIELDTSGAKVANAAQVLLNNAQITASSINEKNCQSALMSTVDTLTEHTQDLKDIWVPLAQQTEHKEIGEQLRRDLRLLLTELDKLKTICQDDTEDVPMVVPHKVNSNAKQKQPDIENIDNILEDIQKNVKEGKTPEPKKVTERLIIEDTPLRSLASKILDTVMTKLAVVKSKSDEVSSKEYNELIAFSKELQAAIKSVDITNAKCRNDPLDARKRQELENAIMNLQQICLLSRRKNGEQNNIIDLADYIGDVTESVESISNEVDGIKREHGSEALMDIKDACERIKENARNVLNLEDEQLADGNIIDDMLKIDQFATDCEKEVNRMNLAVSKINDEKSREKLNDKLQSLECCCDLLRFATKSSISSAESATLDEGLQNLEDIEKKITIILKPTEGDKVASGQAVSKSALQADQTALATAVASGKETELPKALTKYAVQMRGIGADHQKFRLKDHLKKLLDLLKTHAVITCRRVATWQDIRAPEMAATTDQILEELKSFAEEVEKSQDLGQKGSSPVQIIRNTDIKNLLTPSESTVTGDRTQLNNKLQQQIHKLNSISGTIALSLHKPESLSRSLHTTSDAAQQLAAIARGIKSEDPVQHKRIEEAVQEMSIATYNLLKTAESSSHSKNPTDSRRRLLEACRLLNVAINKLGRAAFPADKLRNECSEMNRNLQLQQTFLQANTPTCALSYTDCLDALNNQNDVIHKLRSEEPIPRTDITTSLRYVTSSVCNSAEFAAQSAYLLSLSDADQSIAKHGVVDLARLYKVTEATEDTCLQMICAGPGEQAAELNGCLIKQVQQLHEAIEDATDKVKGDIKHPLIANSRELKSALKSLHGGVHLPTCKEEDFTLKIIEHLDTIKKINAIIKIVPQPKLDKDPKKTSMSTEVIDHTKSLLASTSLMVKKASSSEEKVVTWAMFSSCDVIKAFEALITCIKEKGAEAGFIESLKSQEDQDAPPKSFVQKQVDLVNHWLQKPASKEKDKAAGVKAAEQVTSLAEQMCEDLTGAEREEMRHMIAETKQLLHDCTLKYNSDKAYLLLERLKELRKMLEKGVVTRVVEDFLVEIPLDNLDTLQTETDARKRKFLLEKKIAELLAQLGRVTKTARLVGSTGAAPKLELATSTDQVELLAPALVKAAQNRIDSPDDKNSIKHYEDLLQQYAQSLAKVRDLCDQAVDPIDFAQAAGETMHRIKEDSTVHSNDPQKSIYTSKVILKLGNRVVKAGMKSSLVQHDPELKETLAKIDQTVTAKYDDVKKADWSEVMAEIMKKTSEVESALGGENIFLKQADNNQPIFAAALDLHAAVREWSARDNEIVAVAKRMAVLMARLSDYMNTENKRELLHTSKAIVSESREVAALAKKLALECTDMRIRTNLLQVCERIPTISGQLKMLTTVKGSSFGQGSKEDKEAMTMLVGNAQNLMTSIQEVVKAAASASVKIMSQRGCRMKWVRRNFY